MTGSVGGVVAEAARDEFLQLLVSQMRNQNPLEPIKDQAFIAQLAQFSTLEGIEQLNANFDQMLKLQQLTQGADLLGRTVSFSGDGTQQGTVGGIEVDNGEILLQIAETQSRVPLALVTGMS